MIKIDKMDYIKILKCAVKNFVKKVRTFIRNINKRIILQLKIKKEPNLKQAKDLNRYYSKDIQKDNNHVNMCSLFGIREI